MGSKFSEGDKQKVPEKVKIYWDEELEKFQECVNALYLKTGNMSDILKMNYWRFRNVLKTMEKIHNIESGKQVVDTKVPQSNKDMIARFKELEENKHGRKEH